IYGSIGANTKEIIFNFLQTPSKILTHIFSKPNFDLTYYYTGILLFIPLLNIRLFFIYFLIPFFYIYLSNNNSSLRTISHEYTFLPGIYIVMLLTIVSIRKFCFKLSLKNKKITHLSDKIIIILLLIILFQNIAKDYFLVKKLYHDKYKYSDRITLYNEIIKNKKSIKLLINDIIKNKPEKSCIIATERIQYVGNNYNYLYGFWLNYFIITDDNIFFAFNNDRFPVYAFILDYSFDYYRGDAKNLLKKIEEKVKNNIYYIKYNKYPIIIYEKK
ncbi:hypothetical protein KA977_05965, partial [Candidatus Dependentiae bacterium]|nr:hypothetical protein [Candidatus Dependentiae bacterium]